MIIRLAVNRRTSLRASLEAGLWTFPRLARLARSKEFSLAKSEDNSGLGEEESVTERERGNKQASWFLFLLAFGEWLSASRPC